MAVIKKITHVLFDMDGLLLDTEPFYTQVTEKIVGRYGKQFDWSVKSQMIGKKSIDASRILVQALELPISPEEYLEECEKLLEDLFPLSQPLPGAVEITQHLNSFQIGQAVATSSNHNMFLLKITRHQQWFNIFDCIVTADSPGVDHGKPAPDIFLSAANQLGANPEECLVFEDAPSGMEAALNANMSVVVVPDPEMDKSEYYGAHQMLNSLKEFQPQQWGMPPLPSMQSCQ
ncbi:MAG: HAD-IA family hydrolase [Candidatus Anammoxibacter sp.]